MKHLARLMSLLVLVSAGIFFANCDGGGEKKKTEEEKQLDKLVGNWTVTGVSFNSSTARQAEFIGANLNITSAQEFNFSKTGGVEACPWPSSVDWEFGANVGTQITRLDDDGDVALTYDVNDTDLTITFDYDGVGYDIAGKAKSVSGTWVFDFEKD